VAGNAGHVASLLVHPWAAKNRDTTPTRTANPTATITRRAMRTIRAPRARDGSPFERETFRIVPGSGRNHHMGQPLICGSWSSHISIDPQSNAELRVPQVWPVDAQADPRAGQLLRPAFEAGDRHTGSPQVRYQRELAAASGPGAPVPPMPASGEAVPESSAPAAPSAIGDETGGTPGAELELQLAATSRLQRPRDG
jgi:hypothetical protein